MTIIGHQTSKKLPCKVPCKFNKTKGFFRGETSVSVWTSVIVPTAHLTSNMGPVAVCQHETT